MTSLILMLLFLSSSPASTLLPVTVEQANFEPSSCSSFQPQENELSTVRRLDHEDRASGRLAQLTPTEHLRRAFVYLTNRAFMEALAVAR